MSAIAAGARFLPLTVAFIVTGPLIGRVIDRIGYRTPLAAGAALEGVGTLLLLRVHTASGFGTVWWPFVIIGIGYGLMSTPMAAAVLGAVPRERAGMASSTNLTARLVGGVFGVAILGAALPPARPGAHGFAQQFAAGLHIALVVAAVVAFAGAAIAVAFLSGNRQTQPQERHDDSRDRSLA